MWSLNEVHGHHHYPYPLSPTFQLELNVKKKKNSDANGNGGSDDLICSKTTKKKTLFYGDGDGDGALTWICSSDEPHKLLQ